MKQETYKKLKVAWKIYEYCMYALVFTIGLIALTFGCVYLGRKACEPNIQEANRLEANPKRSLGDKDYFKYYNIRPLSYYTEHYLTRTHTNIVDFGQNVSSTQVVVLDCSTRLHYSGRDYDGINFVFSIGVDVERYFTFDYIMFRDYSDSGNNLVVVHSNGTYLGGLIELYDVPVLNYASSGIDLVYPEALFDFCFDLVFDYDLTTNFNFLDMPNYNRLLSYQIDNLNVYKYNGSSSITPLEIYYHLPVVFTSNGVLFDAITFTASPVGYVSDNNGNITTYNGLLSGATSDFFLTITRIEYQYYGTNTSLVVSSLGVLQYKDTYNGHNTSLEVWLTLNGFNWIDQNYKYLSIYNPSKTNATSVSIPTYINSSSCPLLNLNSYDALTFNVTNNIANNVTDMGLSYSFTLISNAFSGLAGLMAIQILPNLTLGVLVFIPLILTIILVVLKLVKK